MVHNSFAFDSSLAHLCSLMMLRQMRFFSSFYNHFSPASLYRPYGLFSPAESPESYEAQLRRAYGVSANEDLYGGVVQRDNDVRHRDAVQNNTDGANYLKSVISEHLNTLSQEEQTVFKEKAEELDPEIILEIPCLAVKKLISSTAALTVGNTPLFVRKHLSQLEQLRQKQNSMSPQDLWKEVGKIATDLARESDCIASIQKALAKE
jgi:hypothetical protein